MIPMFIAQMPTSQKHWSAMKLNLSLQILRILGQPQHPTFRPRKFRSHHAGFKVGLPGYKSRLRWANAFTVKSQILGWSLESVEFLAKWKFSMVGWEWMLTITIWLSNTNVIEKNSSTLFILHNFELELSRKNTIMLKPQHWRVKCYKTL